MREIKDRVFVVTGAAGGMGRALVKRIASLGGKLAVCDRQGIDALELPEGSVKAQFEITDEASMKAFYEEVQQKFGGADAQISLAGVSIPGQIAEIEEAAYNAMMDSSVRGSMLAAKYFIGLAKEDAQIIHIGSMAALRPNGNAPIYCVAKAAVNTLSTALQLQVKGKGIRVTTLNPGGADTPFWGNRPVVRERLLKADDVVDTMLYVLESNSNIVIHEINFESFEAFRA